MGKPQTIHRAIAALCFLIAFIAYYATMQPTVAFWDCGEFASSASALQVPHPPGAPLWTLLGRIAMMLPTQADLVARYNLLSVFFAASVVMLLYLIAVRIIKLWRGEPTSKADMLTTYGGAFIAATLYTFTDSFWFNALENEVYAFTMFLLTSILWVVLYWYDHAEEQRNERYLLLGSYLIGLTLGAHQMVVLMIFTCVLLVYYRRNQHVTVGGWVKTALFSLLGFIFVYKIVLTGIVGWMDSSPLLVLIIIGGIVGGIWYTQKVQKAFAQMCLWSLLLVIVGYSTYALVMIRSNQDVPMNQNAPRSFKQFKHYLAREQYGDRGFFPRRSLDEFGQKTGPTWDAQKYSSDLDFFWKFQIDHMSNRYLYWNFVGRASDQQEAGTDWSNTLGLPFFLGLFGLFWHFKRDPRRAVALLFMFLSLGLVAALFQNSQDPSARERDYFYVGAYFVFALWAGIGATGIMEYFRSRKEANEQDEDDEETAIIPFGNVGKLSLTFAVFLAVLLIAPINQVIGLAGLASGKSISESSRWSMYSRAGNYVPFDCAYNLLQSCEKDAILFTYGDNDTYPLWCLQDVYGIRRDVRVILLSMANVSWYIDQIKNEEPWGAKKIILQDEQFSNPNLEKLLLSDDPFALKAKTESARIASIPLTEAAMRDITGDPLRTEGKLEWNYIGSYDNRDKFVYTTADQLTFDIIRSNINSRPIYYSVTVPKNFRLGLDQHLAAEGLALRVTPDRFPEDNSGYGGGVNAERLRAFLLNPVSEPVAEPKRGALIRSFNDESAGLAYIDKNFAFNYLMAYMRYAEWMITMENPAEANRALEAMDSKLPPAQVISDVYPPDMIAAIYQRAGNKEKMNKYATIAMASMQKPVPNESMGMALQRHYRMGNLSLAIGNLTDAERIYKQLRGATSDKSIIVQMDLRLMEIQAHKLEDEGKFAEALAKYEDVIKLRGTPEDQLTPDFKPALRRRNALRQRLGDTLGK